MRFASIVKKVLAFLLCLTLLTSNVTVTNATSVDTTDVFAEVSTEMLKETKNAGQEENVSEADSDSNAADLSDIESNVSGQYKQSSDSDGTGDTEKVKNTESTEATEAIEETEKTEETEETEQPELKTVFDYSNDAVRVVVTLSNETDLPAGAELVVAPVAVTAEMEASIDKAMEGESKEKEEVVAYDISFVKDGKEVEPGATVQVQLSLAQVKEGDSASVYHFDETKNEMLDMNANTSADGEVTFGTDHFSKYVIVNHGDNNVTVTIEHYDNSKYQAQDEQSAKIYSDDVCTMAPGAKINDYNKALNWDVDHVQVNGKTFSQSELENIEIHEDSVVKVFYQAKNTDYIGEASFYDYEVIPYDKAGQQRADLSINADSNYPSEQKDNRFTVGTVSQNLSENQYDTVTKKTGQNGTTDDQHINVYTGGTGENAKKTGIVTGLSDDYKEVLFSVNEPGVFPKDGAAAAETEGLTVKEGYRLKFSQSGDTYELKEVLDKEDNVAATAGADFLPFGNNNFYFGIRYDVTFTLGDYIGELNYSFTGDDDLWVILDGKQVVIDLGGIHDALTDTADFWNYIDRTDKNKEHHLTILYMERGAGKANCNMKFTLPNADVIKVVDDDVPDIPPEKPVDFTEKDVEYHKTAKLTDWENREYQIDLDASSLATSQSTVEKIQTVDAMMVFDLSGSMNEILSGENQLKDIGEFSSVKNQMDINKVYYWNKYEKSGWWPWTYDKSVGMGTAAVSGNVYAKYPVKYIDGQWKKYVDGSYQSISDSDVMAAWTSKISALKDAASGFVTGISDTSPDSLVGIATFYGIGNGWNSSTEGKLNHSLSKVNKNEMLKSVNALFADGGTSPQKGLEHAYSELQKAEDDNKKYVILFSDGEPSDSNDKTETEASAVKLKEAGYTVITVGLGLNNETATWLGEKVASAGCAFTADTAEELNKIFQNIQSTITQSRSLTGVQVTDIIDAEFELTDAEIQRLRADGAQVTVNEDGTTTISWLDQEVKPKENSASGWQKTIHIVAKESCLGGNNMTTNVNPNSFLSFGGTQLELPQPTVNVRIAYQITDTADTIFLGENLENYADDAAVRMKDADSARMSQVYLMFYTDKGCREEITQENLKKERPKQDTTYYAKAFLPVEEATDDSNANSTLNGVIYKNEAQVEAAHADGEAYAGKYDVKVKTGTLILTKKISKKDIRACEGDPIFTFKITNQTTGDVYYKTLRFGENSAEDQTTTAGMFNVKAQTTLEGLAQGIYKVEELDTMGFTLKEFTADTNCASQIAGNSAQFAVGIRSRDETCSFDAEDFVTTAADLHLQADYVNVTAKNNKTRSDGKLTDTDAVKNQFVIHEKANSTTDVDNHSTTDVRK